MLKENTLRSDESGLIGSLIILILFLILFLGIVYKPEWVVKVAKFVISTIKSFLGSL